MAGRSLEPAADSQYWDRNVRTSSRGVSLVP